MPGTPEQAAARAAANSAERAGVLRQSSTCMVCEDDSVDLELHGHHVLGYRHPLAVIWLCNSCHKIIHTRGVEGLPDPGSRKGHHRKRGQAEIAEVLSRAVARTGPGRPLRGAMETLPQIGRVSQLLADSRISQGEAARILGIAPSTLSRYLHWDGVGPGVTEK